MMALSTMTPRMPQNSTRCWYFKGMAKKEKIIAMTKTLSIARAFSTAKPVRYSMPEVDPSDHHTQPPKARPRPI